MSNTQKLAFAVAVVASALTGAAQSVEIKITGSTAFRSTVQNAIEALYTSSGGSATRTGTIGNNQVTWTGTMPTLFTGTTVVIKTSFSGSVEGIVNLLGAPNPPGVTQPSYLNPGDTTPTDTATAADIAFSDVVQDTTLYAAPTYTALDGTPVGVVTFGWFKGAGANATSLANITSQQINALLPNGTIAKSLFTGVDTDTAPVYLVGRNALSGTRLVTQADSGHGANSDSTLYMLSGTNPVQDTSPTPGFTSGSAVRGVLQNSSTSAAFVGYVALSESSSIIGQNLTYNGVSGNPNNGMKDAVRNGRYSLWSFLQLYYKPGLSAQKKTLFIGNSAPNTPLTSNGLIKKIDDTVATDFANIQLSTMKVTRPSDGGPITP